MSNKENAMQRTWTTTGEELVKRCGGRDAVESEVESLDWQDIPTGGSLTVGFMPGEAIKQAIRDLEIPKVTRIAIGAIEVPATDPDEDGFYPGFYGIEGNYSNGRARVYLLDTGTILQPVASDYWPKVAEGVAS